MSASINIIIIQLDRIVSCRDFMFNTRWHFFFSSWCAEWSTNRLYFKVALFFSVFHSFRYKWSSQCDGTQDVTLTGRTRHTICVYSVYILWVIMDINHNIFHCCFIIIGPFRRNDLCLVKIRKYKNWSPHERRN